MGKYILLITATIATILLSASIGGTLYAASRSYEFDNPSKPGTLLIISGEGDVTIEGYSGKTVEIETDSGVTAEDNEKAKGMKLIAGSGFSIIKSEEDNSIIITRSRTKKADLIIKVPRETHIIIGKRDGSYANGSISDIVMKSLPPAFNIHGGIMDGDIEISNVTGDIQAETMDGDITLYGVSGTVMVNTLEGDVTVAFDRLSGENPMAFSSVDGDVDVTFPANIKALVTAKAVDGNIYTDFEMVIVDDVFVEDDKNTRKNIHVDVKNNKNKNTGNTSPQSPNNPPQPPRGVTIPKQMRFMNGVTVTGKIGGGGRDILMATIEGDIFIRMIK